MKHYLGYIKNPFDLTDYTSYKFTLPKGMKIFIEREGGSYEKIKYTYSNLDYTLTIHMPCFAVIPNIIYYGYTEKS